MVQVVGKPALVTQFSFSVVRTTEVVKKVGHRLFEFTHAARGRREAENVQRSEVYCTCLMAYETKSPSPPTSSEARCLLE